MDLPAILDYLLLIQFQVAIQVSQHVILDIPGCISNCVKLRQSIDRLLAVIDKTTTSLGQRPLQAGVF